MTWLSQAAAAAAGLLAVGLAAAVLLRLTGRAVVRMFLARFLHRLSGDAYHENLWEAVTGIRRMGAQGVVETELRAGLGRPPLRPFGRFRPFPGFDSLMFDPAQLARLPTPEDVAVDMSVVIGPRAPRPLRIEIPLLVSGLGHAVALSPRAKQALARGSALAGTATNTGLGPLLPAERREARALVVQYNRASWNKTPEILRQADMIEIQLGQGALAGAASAVPDRGFPPALRNEFGFAPGQDLVYAHSRMPGMRSGADLAPLVAALRALTDGVPVGVKIAAGNSLEADLRLAIQAGVDFVTVDGAEGGSHAAPPILADDFGLPTFIAVCRARRFLARCAPTERPTLVVSGGLFTPGHFLKALSLGADAVAIGTAALFAIGYDQTAKALPWEPPLEIVWYGAPAARRLNVDRAAHSLARYLSAVTEEMAMAVRALGKTRLAEVGADDLFALQPWVARLAGVRLAQGTAAPQAGWGPLTPDVEDVLDEVDATMAALRDIRSSFAEPGARRG